MESSSLRTSIGFVVIISSSSDDNSDAVPTSKLVEVRKLEESSLRIVSKFHILIFILWIKKKATNLTLK